MMNECSALQIWAQDALSVLADSPSIPAVYEWIAVLAVFLIIKDAVFRWY